MATPVIMMEEVVNQTTVQMTEDIKPSDKPIDITHLKSIRCYNFGKCMKGCCRIDKQLSDKTDCKCTPLVMTEGTAAVSAIAGAAFGCLGPTILCCESCTRHSSTATSCMCEKYTCWQTALITSGSCFACSLLSLLCCGSIYLCNRCGARCTHKLGCHSFSKGFEDE